MKAIINSVKHIVQQSLVTLEEQTMTQIIVAASSTIEPATANAVVIGSVIKAVYLEYWLLGESSQPFIATWSFEKLPAAATAMTQAQGQALDDYPNKRNIIKLGQGLVGDSNTNAVPIIREWVKIPKGKQRMAQNDFWMFNVSVIGQTDNGGQICGVAIYKEYQ